MAKHRRRGRTRKHGGSQKKRSIRGVDYPRPPAGLRPEHVRNDPSRQDMPGAYVDKEEMVPGAYVDVNLLMGVPNQLFICGSPKSWWDAESYGDIEPGSS